MKNKKLLGVLGVAALLLAGNFAIQEAKEVDAASIAAGTQLYLTPNANWKVDNARFAAYFFGNGEAWVSMTDSNSDGIYEVTSPNKSYTNVIFCRMNPNAAANNWNNKWNQTADLTYDGTNNHYTVKEGTWDKGGGTWSVFKEAGEEIQAWESLSGEISGFKNDGYYVRQTEIYLNNTAVEDLLKLDNGFHADASELVRTTYFEGDQLWMTGENINSGYGTTADGKMNHFTYQNGVKVVDYTVADSTGMEAWYQTMMDLEINEEQGWTANGEIYSSKNANLIEWFKAFTAPCYKGFKADQSNYITFEHVEIEKVGTSLELRLYTVAGDTGKLSSGSSLFSKATVTLSTKTTLAGEFNGWDTNKTALHTTDAEGYLYTEVTFAAGTQVFKIVDAAHSDINGGWLGKADLTVTGIVLGDADKDGNCVFTAEAGTYLFKYQSSTKKLEVTKI